FPWATWATTVSASMRRARSTTAGPTRWLAQGELTAISSFDLAKPLPLRILRVPCAVCHDSTTTGKRAPRSPASGYPSGRHGSTLRRPRCRDGRGLGDAAPAHRITGPNAHETPRTGNSRTAQGHAVPLSKHQAGDAGEPHRPAAG